MVFGQAGLFDERGVRMRRVLKFPIYFYRIIISPWLPRSCRFHPTCSSYALEALEKYGAVKGVWLTVRRLLRCHPWSRCGCDDPVP